MKCVQKSEFLIDIDEMWTFLSLVNSTFVNGRNMWQERIVSLIFSSCSMYFFFEKCFLFSLDHHRDKDLGFREQKFIEKIVAHILRRHHCCTLEKSVDAFFAFFQDQIMLKTIPLFVLVILLFQSGCCRNVKRSYVIEKDYFRGFKGQEYTVYDSQGEKPLYRMEPQFGITHNIQLFQGLKNKDPIAFLQEKFFTFSYKATIAIRNKTTNRWTNGIVEHSFHMVTMKFTINYNNVDIFMKDGIISWDTTFVDSSNQQVVAQFHKKISWGFGREKYQLQVFSDKFPDQLYFFGFVARDHRKEKARTE
jgi:hypothetical protein